MELIGKWNIPASLVIGESTIVYKLAIPFSKLRIKPGKDSLFRMSMLVNDNDKEIRLRVMEWNGGVEGNKNLELFGWVKLR